MCQCHGSIRSYWHTPAALRQQVSLDPPHDCSCNGRGKSPQRWADPNPSVLLLFAVPAELQILSLIKAPPAVPMNMFTLGVEPLISANIVFAVFRLVAKLDVLGEPLFPPLKDYFRSSEQDPRGRMQIERYVSQLVSCFAVVKVMLPVHVGPPHQCCVTIPDPPRP